MKMICLFLNQWGVKLLYHIKFSLNHNKVRITRCIISGDSFPSNSVHSMYWKSTNKCEIYPHFSVTFQIFLKLLVTMADKKDNVIGYISQISSLNAFKEKTIISKPLMLTKIRRKTRTGSIRSISMYPNILEVKLLRFILVMV